MSFRIHIVEDNEFMQEMLVEFLNEVSDFEVSGRSTTAEEAMAELLDVKADLVLVDMALPGMSGAELITHLRARAVDLPCLIYSGHRERGYVDQALKAGARGYLLKGNPDELPRAIRSVLSGEIYVSVALRSTT